VVRSGAVATILPSSVVANLPADVKAEGQAANADEKGREEIGRDHRAAFFLRSSGADQVRSIQLRFVLVVMDEILVAAASPTDAYDPNAHRITLAAERHP
jgi:hypothetical protein